MRKQTTFTMWNELLVPSYALFMSCLPYLSFVLRSECACVCVTHSSGGLDMYEYAILVRFFESELTVPLMYGRSGG